MEEERDGEVLVEEEQREEELVEVVFEAGRAHLRPVAPGRPVGQHCSLLLPICYCQPRLFLTFSKKVILTLVTASKIFCDMSV